MNKIEKLLQTLAPDGVGFRKLGDIGEYIRGVTYKKNQEINDLECGIKVLRANNITLSNYLNFEEIKVINKNVKIKKEQYLKKNDILICAGSGSSEHIGKVAFINTDLNYVFGGFMGVIRIREVNSRFVYHIFTSNIFKQYLEKSLNTTTINNLNANILQNFLIPIPPLEIQQEIVKILDAFTELNTELNTELKARKKQYEYYRNMLLDFNDINQSHKDAKERLAHKTYPKRLKALLQTLAPDGVGFRKLGEVCESTNKKTLKISEVSEVERNGMYPVINSGRDLYGYYHDFNNDGENITIASRGEYAGFINYFNEKFFAGGLCYPYKVKDTSKLLTKFLYFYLKTNESQIMENLVFRGSIPALNKADIENLTIPIPPLEIQQEIVKILDQFSTLTTDLQAGIPAEIELRKKQYEYYREKLLAFKPLNPQKEVKK